MSTTSVSFDRAAAYYDETRGFPPGIDRMVAAWIAQTAGLNADTNILEVGVGTGRIAVPLSAHVGTYTGVDLSRLMMQQIATKRGAERVYPVQGDITRLPVRTHSIDAVIAVHVFHLIPEWKNAFGDIARALRPDGALIHCYDDSRDDDRIALLWDAWRTVVPESKQSTVGARYDEFDGFLAEQGWQLPTETHVFEYQEQFALPLFVERIQQKCWSRMWRLSDEDIQRGVEAIRAAIDEQFDDPETILDLPCYFKMQIYRPPQAS